MICLIARRDRDESDDGALARQASHCMIAKMAARHTREIFRTASDCSASWQGVCV